jgi:hypothetical protein
MPEVSVRIDDARVKKLFKRLSAYESKKALQEFQQYMRGEVDSMFDALSNAGGSGRHRGVSWPGFADQYTRKTDGVTVPAWGGVPKVRGKGKVKGRRRGGRRNAEKRVEPSSAIMQSTGNLRGKATAHTFRRNRNLLTFGTTPSVKYAAHQAEMRPYLFFVPRKDIAALKKIARQRIRLAKAGRG